MIMQHGQSDLTNAEYKAMRIIARYGPTRCDELAETLGAATGAGALAALGRQIRCGTVVAIDWPGEPLPRLTISPIGVSELEGHR